MKTTSAAPVIVSAASRLAMAQDYGWQFSNALSTGPVASGSFIREATTTLVLSETNDPQTGNLALWPGMGTSGGDLIKALASQSWMAPTHAVRGLASGVLLQALCKVSSHTN